MVDDDVVATQMIGSAQGVATAHTPGAVEEKDPTPEWIPVTADLEKYAGKSVVLRLYQWPPYSQIPGPAYWQTAKVE